MDTKTQIHAETHRRLLEAMIEKLRPEGDTAALVYAAQSVVQQWPENLHIGSAQAAQAATTLFVNVAMEIYMEMQAAGSYSRELLPLLHADDSDVSNLLADVALVAKKQIVREHAMQVFVRAYLKM